MWLITVFPSSHINYFEREEEEIVEKKSRNCNAIRKAGKSFITFINSGSQESNVKERTFEQCTPKLLHRII